MKQTFVFFTVLSVVAICLGKWDFRQAQSRAIQVTHRGVKVGTSKSQVRALLGSPEHSPSYSESHPDTWLYDVREYGARTEYGLFAVHFESDHVEGLGPLREISLNDKIIVEGDSTSRLYKIIGTPDSSGFIDEREKPYLRLESYCALNLQVLSGHNVIRSFTISKELCSKCRVKKE